MFFALRGTQGPTPRPVVLLVDDEPDVLRATAMLLKKRLNDVEIVTAADGYEALAALGKRPVAVIVTDYRMPGMNGIEFLQKALSVAPSTPSIMITAFGEALTPAENAARPIAVLRKPFSPEDLLGAVRQAMDGSGA
jgi:two-component system response regulator HupR/HoxA